MKWVTRYVSGYLLLLSALYISKYLFPVAILFALVMDFRKRSPKNGFKAANDRHYDLAMAFDQFANVLCSPLFNRLLIRRKEAQHFFGNITETISYVLGMNQKLGTLTWVGHRLVLVLDCFEANHCLVTIGEGWHPVEPRGRRIIRALFRK